MDQLDIRKRGDTDVAMATREHGDGCSDRKVIARKGNSIFYKGNARVCLFGNHAYHKVDILWENGDPQLEDFHSNGLYGSYRTDYNPMVYEHDILSINTDGNIVIEIHF